MTELPPRVQAKPSEDKAAEDEAAKGPYADESFRSLLDQVPAALWIVAGEDFVYANRPGLHALGCSDVAELTHLRRDALTQTEASPLLSALSMPGPAAAAPPFEARDLYIHGPDGRPRVVEIQAIGIQWHGGHAVLYFSRDVTARREMDQRLALADRLSALGKLTAGIAHGLNNPLAYALLGLEQAVEGLERLHDRSPRWEELRRRLIETRDGIDRAVAIVRRLRGFSRADNDAPVVLDLGQAIAAALDRAKSEIHHRAQVRVEVTGPCFMVGHPPRLEQAVTNLLVNAAHAIPEGRAADHEIRVSAHHDEKAHIVVLEIADDGCGIPAADLPHIFDPFFTTKPADVATGLGLAICNEIVAAHNGTIAIESEVGKGSLFRLSFPAAEPTAAAPPVHERSIVTRAPTPVAQPRKRVLVVDDEPLIVEMVARMLHDEFEVVAFIEPAQALETICRGAAFDVVLCDLMMPGMSGMDLYRAACADNPALGARFVFMTGGTFSPQIEAFLKEVKNPRLEKPFPIAKLRELLAEL